MPSRPARPAAALQTNQLIHVKRMSVCPRVEHKPDKEGSGKDCTTLTAAGPDLVHQGLYEGSGRIVAKGVQQGGHVAARFTTASAI